ncbi:MAG: hypothetical protein IT305_26685 [Chloroflexi bacterium]|nr:hypothetical protein [Chloroflexota bacterium]
MGAWWLRQARPVVLAGLFAGFGIMLGGGLGTGSPGSLSAAPVASVSVAHGSELHASVASADRTVQLRADEFSFQAPESVAAGPVTIQLHNAGYEPHHGQVLRLNDGVTWDQVAAAARDGTRGVLPLGVLVGGPAAVEPGGAAEVALMLDPGQYVYVCFVAGPDGVSHLVKGMLLPFNVEASPDAPTVLPTADGSITLHDFTFDMQRTLPAGAVTLRVVNDGPEPHEISIARLDEGKTVEDARQSIIDANGGPHPYHEIGGMQGLAAGREGLVSLNLEPGQYVALCLIREPRSGLSHVHLGMIRGFTVE